MTLAASQLLQQVLQLSPADREIIAVELMTRLHQSEDSLAEIEAAWHSEIERRAALSDSANDSIPFEEAWPLIAGKYA
jgi:hypothetical protein